MVAQRSTHATLLTEDGARCFAHAKELLGSWEAFEAAPARQPRHAAPLPMYLLYPYAQFYPAKLRRFAEVLRAALLHGLDRVD